MTAVQTICIFFGNLDSFVLVSSSCEKQNLRICLHCCDYGLCLASCCRKNAFMKFVLTNLVLQARAPPPQLWCSRPDHSALTDLRVQSTFLMSEYQARSQLLQTATLRQQLFFPDRRLIQFDCGKLQVRRRHQTWNQWAKLELISVFRQDCMPSIKQGLPGLGYELRL